MSRRCLLINFLQSRRVRREKSRKVNDCNSAGKTEKKMCHRSVISEITADLIDITIKEDSHAEEALESNAFAPNEDEEVSHCEVAVQNNIEETRSTDDSTNAISEKM